MICFNYINPELSKSKNFNSVSKYLNKSLRHRGSLARKHFLKTKERGISETEELALHHDHRDLVPTTTTWAEGLSSRRALGVNS